MIKVLWAFGVVVGVLWLLRSWRRRTADPRPVSPPAEPRPADPSARLPQQRMVSCVHCGVHLPEDEAVLDGDRAYCSTAHLDAARQRRS